MPFPAAPFVHQPILIDVAPVLENGTAILHKKARFKGLSLQINAAGEYRLELITQPEGYSLAGNLIGPGKGVQFYPVNLVADSETAVYYDPAGSPRNGQPLYFLGGPGYLKAWGTRDATGTWQPLPDGGIAATPEPLSLQSDWVEGFLMSVLGPLIQTNIQQANLPPFSRYV